MMNFEFALGTSMHRICTQAWSTTSSRAASSERACVNIYTQLGLDTGISIQTLSTLEVFVEVVTSQFAPVSDTTQLKCWQSFLILSWY